MSQDKDAEVGEAGLEEPLQEKRKGEDSEPFKEKDLAPDHHCTDLICLVLFVAAICAMFSLHLACFSKANPFKILHPLDHAGNSCGVGEMKDFPLVYFPAKNVIVGGPVFQDAYYGNPENRWSVCTNSCPVHESKTDRHGACNDLRPKVGVNGTGNAPYCTWYSESPTTEVFNRYCIVGLATTEYSDKTGVVCSSAQQAIADVHEEARRTFTDLGNLTRNDLHHLKSKLSPQHLWVIQAIEKSIDNDVAQYHQVMDEVTNQASNGTIAQVCADAIAEQQSTLLAFVEDILDAKDVLIICAFWCLFLGVIYLFLVRIFIKAIIYGSMFLSIVGFSVAGYFFWTEAIQVKDTGLVGEASEEKVLGVICWIFAFVLLVVVLACRRQLALSIAICHSTSSFLTKNMGIILLPPLIASVEIAWAVYWFVGLAAILSTAKVKEAHNLTQEVNRYEIDNYIIGGLFFHIFMGLWIYFFFEGLATVTTSMTVTEWYFSPLKKNASKKSSQLAFLRCLIMAKLYHSGSIAFGSFFLPIVVTLRLVVNLLLYMAAYLNQDNGCFRCCLRCVNCCVSFVTRFIQHVSTNAFIMVGIQSRGFCSSAWSVFNLMARNPVRFLVFHGVMWTVDVACRFVLIGATLAFGVLLLDKEVAPGLSKEVRNPWPALLAIAFVGYFIAGLFAGSYTSSGAALFFNFVIDEEVSKQSGRKVSAYAPKGLAILMDEEAEKSNQKKQHIV
jgi:hypothetical protein